MDNNANCYFILNWQCHYHDNFTYRWKLHCVVLWSPQRPNSHSCKAVLCVYTRVCLYIYNLHGHTQLKLCLQISNTTREAKWKDCANNDILKELVLHYTSGCMLSNPSCLLLFLHLFFSMTFPYAAHAGRSVSPVFSSANATNYIIWLFPLVFAWWLNTLTPVNNNPQWPALPGILNV